MLVKLFRRFNTGQHRLSTLNFVLQVLIVGIDEGYTALHLLLNVSGVALVLQLLLDDFDFEGWRLRQLLHAFVGDLGQLDALPHLGDQCGVLELVADIDLGLFGRRYVQQAAQVA